MTKNAPPTVEKINQVIKHCKDLGLIHLITEDYHLNGREITVKGSKLINFGSCSYLGLEVDPRLKAASINAIQKHGTQFSCSRAFVSTHLYVELEQKLSKIFGYPTLLAPTTTLGHMSNIPVLVGPSDAVILDHKVHASVQNSVQVVMAKGTHVEMIRHNNMEQLEQRINALQNEYQKVWYMADGIYSMYGDYAPLREIYQLLEKYDNFHFYVDDAHGMSWAGKNGSGYVLSQIPYHPRMILVLSLAKGFGSCGGALVYPTEELKTLVQNCGSTLMFSGPVQPALLGASIASANIHLSEELDELQTNLRKKIEYFLKLVEAYDLPLVGNFKTPIFFFGVGTPQVGINIAQRLMKKGYYGNLAVYPCVPYHNTGLRFTLNCHHSYADIRNMLSALAEAFDAGLKEENYTKGKIYRAFVKHGFFKEKLGLEQKQIRAIALAS